MKKIQLSIIIMTMFVSLLFNSISLAQTQPVTPPEPIVTGSNSSNSDSIFLPMISNGTGTPPSSVELIDQAVAAGTISPETGLIYKVFATFSDPRLPSQYIGAGIGRDGDGVMAEVVAQAQAKTLSANAIETLTPFFVPPDHVGSWYGFQTEASTQASAPSAPSDWVGIKTANNKVLIGYLKTDAAAAALAPGLKAALDTKIWNNLTTLMGRSPTPDSSGYLRIYLWNSYVDSDGIIVPFDATTLGVTVGTRCDQSATVIYMPSNLSLGDETHAGLIQYVTHELMHAIQFAGTIQNCGDYRWLKEATATWAEDFVYKDANSEWGVVSGFLDHPDYSLDANANLHDYGAYLWPYFLTHQLNDNSIIRTMWEKAATEPNSFMAVLNALPTEFQDYYWPIFLGKLWNKAPFEEYYKTEDQLLKTVKMQSDQTISAASGEQAIPLAGDFEIGAARFYHITVDPSVRSLTILNGLGRKLSIGPADDVWLTDGDQIYQSEELSASDAAGATLVVLMKVAGSDYQMINMGMSDLQSEFHTHCVDVQGKIEDLVIIQSNADFENPTHVISPKGLPTTVFANNLPCWKVSGSSSVTWTNAGITRKFSTTNAVYSYPSGWPDLSMDPYKYSNNVLAYPYIQLVLLSADVNWSISGTDSGNCTYSGSGTISAPEQPGAGSESVTIYNGVLPGSPTYRGYIGGGSTLDDEIITYSITGEDCPTEGTDYGSFQFLEIPLLMDRANIKVPAGSGVLSGSYEWEDQGSFTSLEWNLTPQTK
jgi:hypothetical protein